MTWMYLRLIDLCITELRLESNKEEEKLTWISVMLAKPRSLMPFLVSWCRV